MVIAVAVVRVVKVAVHQVIDVVAVRDRLVTAARPVLVSLDMSAAVVAGRAGHRVSGIDRELVLLDDAPAHVVQVPVVEVIDVTFVLDSRVPAAGAVLVGMIRMGSCHRLPPPFATAVL
jgi:hypothetical protein